MRSVAAGPRGRRSGLPRPAHGAGQQGAQVQRQVLFHDIRIHAQRMAAPSAEQVAVARGQVAMPTCRPGSRSCRPAPDQAHVLARRLVAGEARLMKWSSIAWATSSDRPSLTAVVAAHDALQLGELAHHIRSPGPVLASAARCPTRRSAASPGRSRRAACPGVHGVRPKRRTAAGRWPWRWRAHAPRARPGCPAGCGRPPWTAARRVVMGLVKKRAASARRGRTTRSLRYGGNARVLRADVAHHREPLGEPALGIQQREVLLVGFPWSGSGISCGTAKFTLEL